MQAPSNPAGSQPKRPLPIKVIDLKELIGSAREVHLYHAGELYRLRVTKSNKLILTK
jgi:hemin uptake protein HemP